MPTIATGLKVSIGNTPQAKDDISGGLEDFSSLLDVLCNDLGGTAKTLYSLSKYLTFEDGGTVSAASMISGVPEQTITTLGGATATIVDGKISYETNGNFDYLGAGEVGTDVFSYIIRLSNGTFSIATVTITLEGSNDGVEITSADASGAVVEDVVAASSGTIAFSDVDLSDLHTASFVVGPNATALGTFALDPVNEAANAANGSVGWSYTLDAAAAQYLQEGQQIIETFVVTVMDDSGVSANNSVTQIVTITITGTNDGPVLSDTADPAAALEAADASVQDLGPLSGSFSVSDLDIGDTLDAVQVGDPVVQLNGSDFVLPAGASALVAAGAFGLTDAVSNGGAASIGWSYDPAAANLDFLGEGDSLTITYTVQVGDGFANSATQTVTITITGTNDVPVAIADVDAAVEDGPVINGSVVATDADAGETATLIYALVDPAPVGLTFNADGNYSFDASSYDSLPAGEELVLTIPFTASDAVSTSAPANLVITITGTNDVPVAIADVDAAVEDGPVINGSVAATDADAGETATLTYALVDPGSAPVGLTFNANGSYSFDASSYDSLPEGEELVLTIPFTASDATSTSAPANLVITVTGTNDPPVLAASLADQHSNEDEAFSFAIPAGSFTDVDDAALIYVATLPNGDPLPSWLNFDPDTQTFSGTPPTNFNGVVSVLVEASDGSLSASDTFDLIIDPVNDAPELTGAPAELPDGTEDTPYTVTLSQLLAGWTDVDLDTLSVADLTATNGAVADNGDGSFTITPTADYNGPVTLNYNVSDGTVSVPASLSYELAAVPDDVLAPTDIKFTLAPGTGNFTASLPSGGPLGSLTAVDGDSSSWTFALSGPSASLFALSPTSGGSVNLLVGAANIGQGNYSFTVTATDSGGNSFPETFTLSVGSNNGSTGDTALAFTITSGTDIDFGLNGPDSISGGGGDDALVGGNQADNLTGGGGQDQLLGGQGGDKYIYTATGDSAPGSGDIILDFEESVSGEQINLSAIDAVAGGLDNAFTFVGVQNSNVVANSITWHQSGGNTVIQIDNNGDTTAEMVITLSGLHALTSNDFIL